MRTADRSFVMASPPAKPSAVSLGMRDHGNEERLAKRSRSGFEQPRSGDTAKAPADGST
jgi:hypothetical protein